MKRNRFIICSLILLVTAFSSTLSAQNGTCGARLSWSLDTITGHMTIYGSGPMNNYHIDNLRPWYKYSSLISSISMDSTSDATIGDLAFSGLTNLESISLSNSIKSIGENAFYRCVSLSSVVLPDSLTNIGKAAFSGCSALSSVSFPQNPISIGSFAFDGCSNLSTVHISDICSWCNNVFAGLTSNPLYYANHLFINGTEVFDLIIPNCITKIKANAFAGWSNLQSVNISEGITHIGDYAFYNCVGLSSVILPNSIVSVGGNAFYNCYNVMPLVFTSFPQYVGDNAFYHIDNVQFPGNVSEYSGNRWGAKSYNGVIDSPFIYSDTTKNKLMACWYNADSVIIPSKVNYIYEKAFMNCSNLTSLIIPDSVNRILDNTFNGCTNLSSITIPNSVTSIGANAFYNCNELSAFAIPEATTSIGSFAFYNCGKLSSIIIPGSVTNLGDSAFMGCEQLTTVTLNSNSLVSKNYKSGKFISVFGPQVSEYILDSELNKIGDYAFKGCIGMNTLTIPNSVNSIGKEAFSGCIGLTDLSIPNSVTSMGENAFFNCKGLVSVSISDSIAELKKSLFKWCTHLTSITIPSGVTSIGKEAFSNCESLSSVIIPGNVLCVGRKAFYGCVNLRTVQVRCDSITTFETAVFDDCADLDSIVWDVPNCIDFTSSPFIDVSSKANIYLGNRVKHIPAYFFNGMSHIKEITIPQGVETIGNNALSGCDSLAKVNICNVSSWCNNSFNLTSTPLHSAELYVNGAKPRTLDIPQGVTSVGAYTFYNTSLLTEVSLSSSVTEIGECAFAKGNRLQTITLDSALATIGDSAFSHCPYLISIYAHMEFPILINSSVFSDCGDLSGIDCYVPQGSYALYKKTAVWKDFALHGVPTYTVSFLDWDGTLLISQTVLQGTKAIAPCNPSREGYTFTGWSCAFTNVVSDLQVIAQYEPNIPSDIESVNESKERNRALKVIEKGHLYIYIDGKKYCVLGGLIR